MAAHDILFQPLTIKHVTIPNRFVSTSHQPGYTANGLLTERGIRYEVEKAKGGVGLVQFGGATTVGVENCYYYGQLNGTTDDIIPGIRRVADAIHAHGAVCTVQLSHGGRRDRYDMAAWVPPFAPSGRRELLHRAFPAEMESHDMRRIIRGFASAARRIRDSGVDGVEISSYPPSLIGQFWSPVTNLRTDRYGGSFANRVRFGHEVFEAIRLEVGADFVVGMRVTADEMIEEGLSRDECIEITQHYVEAGLVDYVSVIGGHASDYKTYHDSFPSMYTPSAPFIKLAGAVKDKIDIPVLHATRITDAATAAYAVEQGFIDLVGMTRAFIADPHHVRKLRDGMENQIRPCVGATYCLDRVFLGMEALCLHNVATSREEYLDHEIAPTAKNKQRVIVVGGGPGGLEAARVAAARGHEVTLLEAGPAVGGQLVLAAKSSWRKDLSSIVSWLSAELERLAVEVRLNQLAEPEDVISLHPDVVIIATGGLPDVGFFKGAELATTTWDILAAQVEAGEEVLVFEETGTDAAMVCAQELARSGAKVELVTPDRVAGSDVGHISVAAHMTELYKQGVTVTVEERLTEVRRDGNKLVAVLANVYTGQVEERLVDQVIGDYGTRPNIDLYEQLKPDSKNLGEVDILALREYQPQTISTNPAGQYRLYRIGDAWASRNVHAAMFDAARIADLL